MNIEKIFSGLFVVIFIALLGWLLIFTNIFYDPYGRTGFGVVGFGTKFGTVNKGKSIIAGIGEPEKWL